MQATYRLDSWVAVFATLQLSGSFGGRECIQAITSIVGPLPRLEATFGRDSVACVGVLDKCFARVKRIFAWEVMLLSRGRDCH